MKIRNPRSGLYDTTIEATTPEALDRIVHSQREAQPSWFAAGIDHRIGVLRTWVSHLKAAREQIVAALSTDTGRTAESQLEFDILVGSIERWCVQAKALLEPALRRSAEIPFIEIQQDLAPYGVVGVISPWNFPLLLANIDVLPALLAGCAAVVKPSEITPRFIKPLQQTVDAVPELAAVLRYAAGDGRTGAAVVERVDLVCFTGSVKTGRRVGERCAARFIPAFLELGGKDPAIVTATADVDRAAAAILWGGTVNAGASCLSIERVYVDRRVYDSFVAALVKRAARVELNWNHPVDGEIGPIISKAQIAIIEEHLKDAIVKGAEVATGGTFLEDGGCWLRPTVLTKVDHSMKVMTEETFGPILPIMAVADTDQAVALAEDSPYGLSAAVFADEAEAIAIAGRLSAGAVSINDAALTAMVHEAEKHAFKLSGIGGSRMGTQALSRFMRHKAYLINGSANPDPWWFK